MSAVQHLLALLARLFLSAVFLWSAFHHIVLSWAESMEGLRAKGMPLPEVMMALAVAGMLVGGLSVLVGMRARWGAVILILFLIPTTLVMHDFWNYDPASPEYLGQAINALKNLGLLGGLLTVLAFGPGGFSADTFLRKRPVTD